MTTDLPVDNTALGQRVEGLEQRVGELETLVYGSGPVEDGPVNAELQKELLLASSRVQPAVATGSAVAVAALAAMVLGPFFGGSASRVRSWLFRRRYLR